VLISLKVFDVSKVVKFLVVARVVMLNFAVFVKDGVVFLKSLNLLKKN